MSTASILMVHLVYPHNYYLSLQPQSRKLLTVFNTHRQGMLVWIIEHSIPCTFTSIHITAIRVMITQDGYVFKGKITLGLIRKQILPKPWQMISPYQGSPCQYMRVLRDTMSVRNVGKRIGFCDHRRRTRARRIPLGGKVMHGDVMKWKHFLRYWPLCGEFTCHRWIPLTKPVTLSFDIFFDLCMNKRLSIQSWQRLFETSSRSLWRHCNGLLAYRVVATAVMIFSYIIRACYWICINVLHTRN